MLYSKGLKSRTSLAGQWLRTHLTVQGTWVPAPLREDDMRCEVPAPVPHNYWVGPWSLCSAAGESSTGRSLSSSAREQPTLAPTGESPPAATKAWALGPLDCRLWSEMGNRCRVTFQRGYSACPGQNGIENKDESREPSEESQDSKQRWWWWGVGKILDLLRRQSQ